jgi:hypothetical protein
VDLTSGTSRHLSTPKRLARVARPAPTLAAQLAPRSRRDALSAFSKVMGPLLVHPSADSPKPRRHTALSPFREARPASRRSSLSNRRLWGAHSSVVANSHDHAVDPTVGIVAKHKLAPVPSEWWIVANAQLRSRLVPERKDSSGSLPPHDRVPRVASTRMTKRDDRFWPAGLWGPADAIGKAIARRVPPASSCMTTAQPGRTSSPPRPARPLLPWHRHNRHDDAAVVEAIVPGHRLRGCGPPSVSPREAAVRCPTEAVARPVTSASRGAARGSPGRCSRLPRAANRRWSSSGPGARSASTSVAAREREPGALARPPPIRPPASTPATPAIAAVGYPFESGTEDVGGWAACGCERPWRAALRRREGRRVAPVGVQTVIPPRRCRFCGSREPHAARPEPNG